MGMVMKDNMPFGLKIAIINRAFRKRLDEKASAMGLTSVQLRVLGSVSRLEETGRGEIHQNDLEKLEHVTHPAMTKILQKLQSKGFVECVSSANDRRYKKVTCTEKSKGIHNVILAHDREVFDEMCKYLPEERKRDLCDALDLLLSNIDSDAVFTD